MSKAKEDRFDNFRKDPCTLRVRDVHISEVVEKQWRVFSRGTVEGGARTIVERGQMLVWGEGRRVTPVGLVSIDFHKSLVPGKM